MSSSSISLHCQQLPSSSWHSIGICLSVRGVSVFERLQSEIYIIESRYRILCYSVSCYSATLLLRSATLLLCYSATLLLCYSATATPLLCYSATLLLRVFQYSASSRLEEIFSASNMVIASPDIVADLRKQLLDQTVPIAQRFRTLFSLRNCSGDEAREALEAGM